ncbi:MAG TPA: cyclic pyranopterin monophosphate synthase MoaC [Magnetospirillaceae bacterium]|nr:cyclic pyranopterin monophosphate synthase MoaC [Magnetospirillaceae bacterium]
MADENGLTHVDRAGQARMVDVSGKPRVRRTARAEGFVVMDPRTASLVRENALAKGDVLAAARLAGIMAAKRTAELIPLCHNIGVEHAEVRLEILDDRVRIVASAACTDKTGIEMEALTAVCVAALTVYDMCKAVDKGMRIEAVRLTEKTKENL